MRNRMIWTMVAVNLLIAGCAIAPLSLRGDFADVKPAQASLEMLNGTSVRWGGIVTGVRSTDAGQCLEIAWYPLDRYTLRPTVGLAAYIIAGQPLFLACGLPVSRDDLRNSNGTITLVGNITPSQVYEVPNARCVKAAESPYPIYAGSLHATNESSCIITFPTVQVASIHAWPVLPSKERPFNNMSEGH